MIKRVLSILLILITFTGSIPASVLAANTPEEALGEIFIYNGDYELGYLTMNGAIQKQKYTYYMYKNPDGNTTEIPAYCVNPTQYGVPQTVAPGESIEYLAESKSSDPRVVGIIANGYPHKDLDDLGLENKQQGYYATKMALWCYIIPSWDINKLGINPNLSGAERTRAEKILAAAKKTYTQGMYWSKMYEPSITTSVDREAAYPVTVNGTAYKQQIITVRSETFVADRSLRVSFDDAGAAPAGTRIVNLDNQDTTEVPITTSGNGFSGQFKVLYPAASVENQTGSVQFNFAANVAKYAAYYAICAEKDKYGNLQNYIADTDPYTSLRHSAVSKFAPDTSAPGTEPDTGLKIKKVEAGTSKPLNGAIFEVKDPDGRVIGTYNTDTNGEIILPLTITGNYTVTELYPPEYYLPAERQTQSVTVSHGNVAIVTFANEPYGDLRVEKIDGRNGYTLEGAKIQIKHIETGAIHTETTGTGGSANFTKLVPGAYEIKEISAPDGYIADGQTHTIHVVKGSAVSYTLKNEARPGLTIVKYDASTMERLPETTFEVYRDAVLLGEYTTNALGEINLYDLTPGTYLVKEIAAPDSHVVNSSPQQIELKGGDGILQLIFFNELKPGIHIKKVDSQSMQPLPNAKFLVKQVGGSYEKEYVSDETGTITLEKLEPGAYTVTEIVVPNGYLLDEAVRTIQINAGEDAVFVFTNTKRPSFSLVKFAPHTGTYLSGAVFRIAKIEDGSHYLDRVTDADGRIEIEDLESGIYSVKEIAAPSGYTLNEKEYHVELFPGRTSQLVVENYKKPELLIIKKDAVTGERLAGVSFTVNKVDSSTLATVTTDANGEALLSNMEPGVYSVKETYVPAGYLLDETPKLITLFENERGIVQFENYPKPGLTITKVDSITKKPLKDAKFHVIYASNNTFSGEINDLGYYYTDASGRFMLSAIEDGWYRITEVQAPDGYRNDHLPSQDCYLKAGTSKTITFENTPLSGLTIRKIDSDTRDGLYGATFLLYDKNHNPIGKYTTDKKGYIYVEKELEAGRYYLQEIAAPEGYILDDELQSIQIKPSGTTEVVWQNTAVKGQIQIVKKSAEDNVVNGFPAGTLLSGAVFEVYDKAGNTVDTITTDKNGRATSKLLPLSRYTVREVKVPPYYAINETIINAYLEHEGQIVTFEVLNKSVSTGVQIKKTGYFEVMPNQPLRYTLTGIGNTSTVPLESFYWRDTLPVQAVRLQQIITGTYNQPLPYKVTYKTNLWDHRTLADNLSTTQNYVLDARPAALELASNEYVTEIMFVFGQVKAGFAQVETPYIQCYTLPYLTNGMQFVNKADVGGIYQGQWIMAVSRWVTTVYTKPIPLPRTGH